MDAVMDASPEIEKPRGTHRPNVVRRLYDWVVGWADTPYGTPALAAISFAESSFFPIPPDVLQIALSFSKPKRSYFYAAVSAVASVLGGIVGWIIGVACWAVVGNFFFNYVPGFSQENFDTVGKLYEDNAFLALLAAAFTPIPYKVFTIAAGVFSSFVPLSTLILASAVGRTGRFMLVATVIYFFGPLARRILERYFELATLILFALFVGGFLVIRYLF
jgi:membrane protein YqaA with SNARE-associated domain